MEPAYTYGLDLSLTGTGLSITEPDTSRHVHLITSAPAADVRQTWNRLVGLAEQICDHMIHPGTVAIEGPSMASKFGHPHDRSGLWWLVADDLYSRGFTVLIVPPTCRAMYATGKGNAPKDQVLADTVRKWPHLPITNNNIADAVTLNDMAARWHYGQDSWGEPAITTKQLKGMDGVKQ